MVKHAAIEREVPDHGVGALAVDTQHVVHGACRCFCKIVCVFQRPGSSFYREHFNPGTHGSRWCWISLGGTVEDTMYDWFEELQRSGVVLRLNGSLIVSGNPVGRVLKVLMPPELLTGVPVHGGVRLCMIITKYCVVAEHPVILF